MMKILLENYKSRYEQYMKVSDLIGTCPRNYSYCLECNSYIFSRVFRKHILSEHNLPYIQYFNIHFGSTECIVEGCNNTAEFEGQNIGYCCSQHRTKESRSIINGLCRIEQLSKPEKKLAFVKMMSNLNNDPKFQEKISKIRKDLWKQEEYVKSVRTPLERIENVIKSSKRFRLIQQKKILSNKEMIVYLLEFSHLDKKYLKIGITSNLQDRLDRFNLSNDNVLFSIRLTSEKAFKLENTLLDQTWEFFSQEISDTFLKSSISRAEIRCISAKSKLLKIMENFIDEKV